VTRTNWREIFLGVVVTMLGLQLACSEKSPETRMQETSQSNLKAARVVYYAMPG